MRILAAGVNTLFTLLLIVTILLQALLIYSAGFGAPIIQQVEAEIGHSLSCGEAYVHREIDGFFYPDYRAQGDILYLAALCGPFWMGLLLLLILSGSLVTPIRQQAARLKWLLTGVVVALMIPVLIYLPTIQKIACAVE